MTALAAPGTANVVGHPRRFYTRPNSIWAPNREIRSVAEGTYKRVHFLAQFHYRLERAAGAEHGTRKDEAGNQAWAAGIPYYDPPPLHLPKRQWEKECAKQRKYYTLVGLLP